MKIKFRDRAERNFEGFVNADLRGADLQGADLHDANLQYVNLQHASLCGADLRGADLYCADLRGADLQGADLRHADLRHADLRGADLRGADLDFASWPLWCGSLEVRIDNRIACQLLYHTMQAMEGCDDPEVQEFLKNSQAKALANQCHRAVEGGTIK